MIQRVNWRPRLPQCHPRLRRWTSTCPPPAGLAVSRPPSAFCWLPAACSLPSPPCGTSRRRGPARTAGWRGPIVFCGLGRTSPTPARMRWRGSGSWRPGWPTGWSWRRRSWSGRKMRRERRPQLDFIYKGEAEVQGHKNQTRGQADRPLPPAGCLQPADHTSPLSPCPPLPLPSAPSSPYSLPASARAPPLAEGPPASS
jgi:hypothetical protein